MELWSVRVPETSTVVAQAERAQQQGWDGIAYTDSQNLVGDPFVAAALAATVTDTLRFATGVTNAFTRHPAALATVAATVQETSGGRFVLGIGRGDTALFHLGRKPMPVARFTPLVEDLQTYLAKGTVDCDGHPSRLHWLDRTTQPKVPLDVAASGPRVIDVAARTAERVTFAVGADPDRLAWALELARTAAADAGRDPSTISFGAYVTVGCHPDLEQAAELIAGSVAAFAHFSSMPGSTGAGLRDADRAVVAEVGRRYDSNQHLSNRSPQTEVLDPTFVSRFAIIGPPERCARRFAELHCLGLDRFVITGPGFGADPDHARTAHRLLVRELLPALREQPGQTDRGPTSPAQPPNAGVGRAAISPRAAGATPADVIALSDHVYERTRRRIQELTDHEYLWEPVAGCWSVRPDTAGILRADAGTVTGDPPLTTIAWRLWHLVSCYGSSRNARWLGIERAPSGFEQHDPAPSTADGAIQALERAHTVWREIITTLPDEQWTEHLGPIAGPYADQDKASLVLHQLDEQIHHGAELGTLRDLYRATVPAG